jgi:hypothetical protein
VSESNRISVLLVKFKSFLISVFVLTSFCSVSGQKSESSTEIENAISINRNSSAGKTILPMLTVSSRSLRVYSGEGGTSEIIVISNSPWTLKCSDIWISANTETGGGFDRVVFTVKENAEAFERIAKIRVIVKGLPVRIIELSQKARHDE